jgi:hypothetical protein
MVGNKINYADNQAKNDNHGDAHGIPPPFSRKSDFCAANWAAMRFQHKRIVLTIYMTARNACVGNHLFAKPPWVRN